MSQSDPLDILGSIWYHSKPSGVPLLHKQEVGRAFFFKQYSEAALPLQNFFFPILGSFETLNQLGDCYPNPSSVLSEPVSSGAAFVRSTKVFKKVIK